MESYIIKDNISNIELLANNQSFDYFTWTIILISFLTIIISKLNNPGIIKQLIFNTFTDKQNQKKSKGLHNILLNLNFPLIISLFVNKLLFLVSLRSDWLTYIYCFVGTCMIIISKSLIIYIIDVIFKRNDHFHIVFHLNFYKITGIILAPLFVFTYYITEENQYTALMISLIIIIMLILIREIKSFFVALKYRISLLYIILYLCTLEILPLILVFSILKG